MKAKVIGYIRLVIQFSKPFSLLKYILSPLLLQCQTPAPADKIPCDIYKKYTLDMKELGKLQTHSYSDSGKWVTINYVDYLVLIDDIVTLDADSAIYKIPHPDYPQCKETYSIIVDTEGSIEEAKDNDQVRVMLMLEIRDNKQTWKLGRYQR